MSQATKKTARKKTAAKKTTRKKAPAKKAAPATKLPETDPAEAKTAPLPRGQMRLADGTIGLKTGDHDLGDEARTYDVHGARMELSGKVLIAGKDINWIAVTKCQKCGTPRATPVNVSIASGADGSQFTVVSYRCENEGECQLGGRQYICVYSPTKLTTVGSC